MEIERSIAPNALLFSAPWATIYSDVAKSIQDKPAQTWVKSWLERQVMKKYSVSYNMMLLSMLFMCGWLGLGAIKVWRIVFGA